MMKLVRALFCDVPGCETPSPCLAEMEAAIEAGQHPGWLEVGEPGTLRHICPACAAAGKTLVMVPVNAPPLPDTPQPLPPDDDDDSTDTYGGEG